jgi:hypothetical protein
MTNLKDLNNDALLDFLNNSNTDDILQKISNGSGFDDVNPFTEDMLNEMQIQETEQKKEVLEDTKPKKRKRRTKAEIEADKLKEQQEKEALQKEEELMNEEVEDVIDPLDLDQTENYIVDLESLEPTKKKEKVVVADNFFDDFDSVTVDTTKPTKTETKQSNELEFELLSPTPKKEKTVSKEPTNNDFNLLEDDFLSTKKTTKKPMEEILEEEFKNIIVEKPPIKKENKFDRLNNETNALNQALYQHKKVQEKTKTPYKTNKATLPGENLSIADLEKMIATNDEEILESIQQPSVKPVEKTEKLLQSLEKTEKPLHSKTTHNTNSSILTNEERFEIQDKIKQIIKEELQEQILRQLVQDELKKVEITQLIKEEIKKILKK